MLGPNRVIAKDVKKCTYLLMLSKMHDIDSKVRGSALAPRQVQLITLHSYDFQTKVVKGCILVVVRLGSMIYWMGLWTSARCVGRVP